MLNLEISCFVTLGLYLSNTKNFMTNNVDLYLKANIERYTFSFRHMKPILHQQSAYYGFMILCSYYGFMTLDKCPNMASWMIQINIR